MSKILTIILSSLIILLSSPILQINAYRGPIINQYRFDLEVDPGDVVQKSFTVKHDYEPLTDGSVKSVDLFPRALDFTHGDFAGVPYFLAPGSLPRTASLAQWITIDTERITLDEQNEEIEVTFTISVPEDADPGGHYAAVLLSNQLGELAIKEEGAPLTGLGLNSELGPLIFLTVSGDISKNIDLVNLYTRNIKGNETSFFTNPPIDIVAAFENTGNVHVIPRGVVIIHRGDNLSEAIQSFPLNPNGNAVLPGATREFSVRWDDSFISSRIKEGTEDLNDPEYYTNYNWDKLSRIRIGQYTATVQYEYELVDGTSTPSVFVSTNFTVIPWQLILLLAIPVIILLAFIYYKYRKYKNE